MEARNTRTSKEIAPQKFLKFIRKFSLFETCKKNTNNSKKLIYNLRPVLAEWKASNILLNLN